MNILSATYNLPGDDLISDLIAFTANQKRTCLDLPFLDLYENSVSEPNSVLIWLRFAFFVRSSVKLSLADFFSRFSQKRRIRVSTRRFIQLPRGPGYLLIPFLNTSRDLCMRTY